MVSSSSNLVNKLSEGFHRIKYKFGHDDKKYETCETYETFILMNIWMIEKNSMKHHYLKKKIFTVTEIWKTLVMQIMRTEKEFEKNLK